MSKIVKNTSEGYGYKYSSLADLAEAGIDIPKMRVHPSELGEFVEYWDGEQWQTGARIVPFDGKGMNAAQAYGAALTYARRYTVQLAQAVACDDDKGVETAKPVAKAAPAKSGGALNDKLAATTKQKAWLKRWFIEKEGLAEGDADIKVATYKTMKQASEAISGFVNQEKEK